MVTIEGKRSRGYSAFDYLPKNFSVDQLRVAVERGLRQRELQLENLNLKSQFQGALGFANIIGRSPAMARVFELVRTAPWCLMAPNVLLVDLDGVVRSGRAVP